ncbi:hypothetical protein DH2020_007494 [Rehmannia glutinosa]|uniref:Uncharacterized protein n=1 Tax=Rehmannia glutinosa TaxID=99300 RepID=A0ABR0TZA5_REHGL
MIRDFFMQMKMEQKVESVKAELLLGLKEREAFIYKHRYENADDDLADFREWFDYLSQKCAETKDISDDVSNKGEGSRNKALQNELLLNRAEELQISNDKLRIDFTKMESESVQKSEEIFRLLKEIELLKSRSGSAPLLLRPCRTGAASRRGGENSTSDGGVIKVKKESDPSQTSEKSAYGAWEMDWTYAADTQHMSSDPRNLPVDDFDVQDLTSIAHKKQSAHKSTGGKAPRKQFITKGSSSSSKRKAVDVITIEDSPKLFTSSFKIPKLKSSSSPKIV